MVKTQAIVANDAAEDWRIEDIELAEPNDDELLVEMVAAVGHKLYHSSTNSARRRL